LQLTVMQCALAALWVVIFATLSAAVQVHVEESADKDDTGYELIKHSGFRPENILDVNYDKGEWTRVQKKKLFPRAKFHGSECKGIDACLQTEGLGDAKFELVRFDGDECSYVKGGDETLAKATAVQLKIPFAKYQSEPSFSQYLWYMAEKSYTPFDITGFHYSPSGYPAQVDVLFLKENCTHHMAGVKAITSAKAKAFSKVQKAPSSYEKLIDLGFKPRSILDITQNTEWRQSMKNIFPGAELKTGDVNNHGGVTADEQFDLIHIDVSPSGWWTADPPHDVLRKAQVLEVTFPFIDIEDTAQPFYAALQRFVGTMGFEPFSMPERRRSAGKGYLQEVKMVLVSKDTGDLMQRLLQAIG